MKTKITYIALPVLLGLLGWETSVFATANSVSINGTWKSAILDISSNGTATITYKVKVNANTVATSVTNTVTTQHVQI